jgi:hypothetical protein
VCRAGVHKKGPVMRRKQAFRPTMLEALEDRVVLSHVHPHAHVAAAAIQIGNLSTRITGVSQSVLPTQPGGNFTLNLNGTGQIKGAGRFRATGSIVENPSVAPPFNEQSQGTLLLKNGKGTITLSLNGPAFDFSQNRQVTNLTFNVVDATGAYAPILGQTVSGTGSIMLRHIRTPGPNTTVLRGNFILLLQTTPTPVA